MMNLWEVAGELSRRMTSIFLQDERGRRPVFGNLEKFQADPHWRDLVLFHEYFHGDSGAGVGASHQTGWTGVVTKLMQQSGESSKRKKPEQSGCDNSRRLTCFGPRRGGCPHPPGRAKLRKTASCFSRPDEGVRAYVIVIDLAGC